MNGGFGARASIRAAANITGRDGRASAAIKPAPRWRTRTTLGRASGHSRARAGSVVRVTARSTVTRRAPRLRLRLRIRVSPSRSFRSAARAPPSTPDSSTANARASVRPGTAAACSGTVRAQIAELTELLASARRHQTKRSLDLVLLTIGANDILFSGLIANVMIEAGTERSLLSRAGIIASVEDAQTIFDRELPGNFAKARAVLKPLVGGNLSRVVYVTYGNPALAGPNTPCPGGRDGFDVHPAFAADGGRLRQAVEFVSQRFLPGIKALARCEDGKSCSNPSTERMTFVDAHQPAFASHGACARAADDPAFDRECFSRKGETFESSLTKGAMEPMACGYPASEFRPYAPRARWIRTANDSYFTAMTYPEGLPAVLQPSDLHDAIWGIFAAVYGGAVHPTAEGHAAMADAALPAAREVLGLPTPSAPRLPTSGR
jgi:hypothetical protein